MHTLFQLSRATHCNTLQHTATHYTQLQCVAVCCSDWFALANSPHLFRALVLWCCLSLALLARTTSNLTCAISHTHIYTHTHSHTHTHTHTHIREPVMLADGVTWGTATNCHTLHHIATHRNTPQHTATRCNTGTSSSNSMRKRKSRNIHSQQWTNTTPQHTATHCNTPQHTATHCNTLQHTATHCNTPTHTHTNR